MSNHGYNTDIEKCELRRKLLQELGIKVSQFEKDTKKNQVRWEAARSALAESIQYLTKHKRWWDEAYDKEQCTELEKNAAYKAVEHCCGIIRNSIAKIQAEEQKSEGALEAYSKVLDMQEKAFEDEGKKGQQIIEYFKQLAEFKNAEETGEKALAPARPPGVHPGPSLAAQRHEEPTTKKKKSTKRSTKKKTSTKKINP